MSNDLKLERIYGKFEELQDAEREHRREQRERIDELTELVEALMEREDGAEIDATFAARLDRIHDMLTEEMDLNTVSGWTPITRDPDNPAIQNQAERLGITPVTLVEQLEQRDEEAGIRPIEELRPTITDDGDDVDDDDDDNDNVGIPV